jgi:hypothetical protein
MDSFACWESLARVPESAREGAIAPHPFSRQLLGGEPQQQKTENKPKKVNNHEYTRSH